MCGRIAKKPQLLADAVLFSLLVSNTDDHQCNHGFLLMPGKGWRLSDAFDMNPVLGAHDLKFNIS
ncbi:HipA domain-containing protein [Collimonas antrihumi]|uniref:HipA domain-containing protein n=1 Tax=Collimonas antrihumi TaxID=1940615 RepID=UPI001B8BDA89|nr:HipA domain-containing protein [Collimonas antrihumi]